MRATASEAQAGAIAIVAVHGGIIVAALHVTDELEVYTTSIVLKDVIPIRNLAATASSASDIVPTNSMCAPENISTVTHVSPTLTSVLDIVMLLGKLILQNIRFTIPTSRCVVGAILDICDESVLILWPPPMKWGIQKLWPPPTKREFTS